MPLRNSLVWPLGIMGCLPLCSAAAACPHTLARGDAPNLVPLELGEPQIAIRAGGDAQPLAAKFEPTVCGQGEPGDAAASGAAPDAIPKLKGEPQVAIRPARDALRPATEAADVKLGDAARGGDAPN